MKARCRAGCEWQQRGSQTAHCGSCHRTFSSERGFDDHRQGDHETGSRVCVDPGTLTDRNQAPRYTFSGGVWRSARQDTRWTEKKEMA